MLVLDRVVDEQELSVTLAPAEREVLVNAKNKGRWKPVLKQRLIVGILVLADMFLALVVWGAAAFGKSILGPGVLSDVAVGAIAPSVVVWVGLRALLGLYPGYGLDSAERL